MHPIYLDNASTSFPKPACVPDAVYRYMTACGSNVSRGGYRSAYSAEELVFETRERLCALFHGGDARCVVFTPNITTSLNLLLKGFLRPGDHVLVSSMEHNAVVQSGRHTQAFGGGSACAGKHEAFCLPARKQRLRNTAANQRDRRVLSSPSTPLLSGQRADCGCFPD